MNTSPEKIKALSQSASDRSIKRIKELLEEGLMQADIVNTLNAEGYTTIRQLPWTPTNLRQVLFKLRARASTWYGLSARRAGLSVAGAPC